MIGEPAGPAAAVTFAALGRRERKRAGLRLGVLAALRDRIRATPFDAIPIADLAAAVDVSPPTFFAHFATKSALLTYYIHLWRIGVLLAIDGTEPGEAFIRSYFERTAEAILDEPAMWFTITGETARTGGLCEPADISAAERLLAFDDDPRALTTPCPSHNELFTHHVAHLVKADDVAWTVDLLIGTFYGIPLALGPERLADLPAHYRRSLDLIMSGDVGRAQ